MTMIREKRNPWMGLVSYQDPETSEYPVLFCGRGNESYDVSQLIENSIFVTLYGRSGTGKTSLLNAGVFPILRQDHFMPISIRLGIEAIETSFQHCILKKITDVVNDRGGFIHTVDVVPLAKDEEAEEYLWSHFARTRYEDKEGHLVYPVIVLDQFEEVFRERREEADVLLRQIYFMMNDTHILSDRSIDGIPYVYDFNFRFVVTIREDDLFRLEDSIDNNYLSEMKRCRFRLRNLSLEGAREVILKPADGLFKESDRDKITDIIISMAQEEGNTVSSNILSLVCSRLFIEHIREGGSEITLPLVEKLIKQNLFEQFYKEATQGLSARERSYIEIHLVDSSGRRNSVPESDFFRHVKNGEMLFEGDRKILQRVMTSSNTVDTRVELIHDSFCEPVAVLKEKRERQKIVNGISLAMAVALVSVVVGIYTSQLNRSLLAEKERSDEYIRQLESERARGDAAEDRAAIIERERTVEQEAAALEMERHTMEIERARMDLDRLAIEAEQASMRASQDSLRAEQANSRIALLENLLKDEEEVSSQEDESVNVRIEGDTVIADDIDYEFADPTESQILNWKSRYNDICLQKIRESSDYQNYDIPTDMMEDDPCVVYLILNSRSLEESKDKQEWFDLYSLMNEEQVYKLYYILYREKRKLGDIQILAEANKLNQEAYQYAKEGAFSRAHSTIDRAIAMYPEEANFYDSKGEFYLMQGNNNLALTMWERVIQLDPDFSSKHSTSNLYKGLLELGMIEE